MRCLAAVLVCVACGNKTETTPAKGSAVPAAAPVAKSDVEDLATKQDLEAVAANGRFFVTRANDKLTVWARDGHQVAVVDAMFTGKPGEYERYAVDGGGSLLAEQGEHSLRVLELASKRELWRRDDATTVWGNLELSPSATQLAVLVQSAVLLVDARTGQDITPLDADNVGRHFPASDSLTLPRRAWFSPDGKWLAIRCGSNAESPANHSIYIANIDTRRLEYVVYGHAEQVVAAQWLSDGRLVTLDGRGIVRTIRNGIVDSMLPLGAFEPSTFAVTDDLSTTVIADNGLLVRREAGVGKIEMQLGKEVIAYVEVAGDRVVAITTDGHLTTHPIPALTEPKESWVVLDDRTKLQTSAIWGVAINEPVPISIFDGEGGFLASARAYTAWKRSGAKTAFKGPVSTELADRFISGGFLQDAVDVYSALLASKLEPGYDRLAADLGVRLASQLASVDAEERFIAALYKRWPKHRKIVARYAATLDDKPRIATLTKAVAADPHAVDLWIDLAFAVDKTERQGVIERARKILTEAEAAELVARGPR